LRDAVAVHGEPLSIPRPDGTSMEAIVGCAPITDGYGRLRGCIVTFDDVTEVHRANEQLRHTLNELEQSRGKIRLQNEELRRLAARDSLTGCYNRRAFFDIVGELFADALRRNTDLSCIMADIDHFKQFNDLYGHAVGDQVIQVVARALGVGLRNTDILCRYGGEEFCIVLPGATLEQARAVAERMRVDIAERANLAVRSIDITTITSSFGVASITEGATRVEELIDQADNALYDSKEGGRNKVSVWKRTDL
jgi:diguanylate cyclase (GGDEF)-like protein